MMRSDKLNWHNHGGYTKIWWQGYPDSSVGWRGFDAITVCWIIDTRDQNQCFRKDTQFGLMLMEVPGY